MIVEQTVVEIEDPCGADLLYYGLEHLTFDFIEDTCIREGNKVLYYCYVCEKGHRLRTSASYKNFEIN
jgi:hypothetical protein